MKRSFLLILCLLALLTTNAQAQDPLDHILEKVQDYFHSQYGRDYVLIRYEYTFQTWPDTSYGCPQPGRAYQQETVQGYQWTIEISDNGTNSVYELHSNQDGSIVVLCTPIDRAKHINYSTYQNGVYLIDYPNTWLVSASSDLKQVTISPSGTINCAEPGMIIELRQPIGNANTMLDDAIREAGVVQNVGVRTPIGDSALTLLYQTGCNGAILQYRASAFPIETAGTGYLVRQWATEIDYLGWENVYLQILDTFRTITPGDTTNGDAIEPEKLLAGYPLAHVFVNDIYIGEFGNLPGYPLTVGSSRPRRGLTFSSDGQYLAYVDYDPTNGTRRLDVASSTYRRTTFSNNVASQFYASWLLNSPTLAFVEYVDENIAEDGNRRLAIKTATIDDPRNPQTVGTIPFFDNCEVPPSTPYITEQLYWLETGSGGNRFIFAPLPDGRYLFTARCDGTGLALWNPADNSVLQLGDDLRRAALSPDRTRLAAIGENQVLYTINLTDGTRNILNIEFPADQITWSNDGTKLYYTNIFAGAPFTIDDASVKERAEEQLGIFPYQSLLNSVTIIEYDFNTGATRTMWQGEAYAVGKVLMAPNNAGILFTVIPSDREYIVAFVQGSDPITLRFAQPETEIYWLPVTSQEATLIAVSSQPVFAPVVPVVQQ